MPAPTQTAPETTVRAALQALLAAEFADVGMKVYPGKLHAAMGEQTPLAGVYPLSAEPGRRALDQETLVGIQVFARWKRRLAPGQPADPAVIEQYAERLREAIQDDQHPAVGSRGVWYFRLLRVIYEEDPVGQVTRFTAVVQAFGENFAETTA
jgi:hypothetical protein